VNLATQPFRNERLQALGTSVLAVFVVVTSIAQAIALYTLRGGAQAPAQSRVAVLESEIEKLRAEAEASRSPVPKETLARWNLVKDLVDRRALSWTDLFSRLEGVLPRGVRLVSVMPTVEKGQIKLAVSAVGRTPHDGRELVRLLSERPDFQQVSPLSESSVEDGTQFTYSMRYLPERRPTPLAAPGGASPAPPDGSDEDAEDSEDAE
jgi:Tfp pilus assembly protein PilN